MSHQVDQVLRQRRAYWRSLNPDLLAVRQSKAARIAVYHDCWSPSRPLVVVATFYRHPGFRPYVLPNLRAFLTAREKARSQAWKEKMRADAIAYQAKKAAARASQLDMFAGV